MVAEVVDFLRRRAGPGDRGKGRRHDRGRRRPCGGAARGRRRARDRVRSRSGGAPDRARAPGAATGTASRRCIDASPRSERPKPRGRCKGSSSTWECRRCSWTSPPAGSGIASTGRSTCGWVDGRRHRGGPRERPPGERARRSALRVRAGASVAPGRARRSPERGSELASRPPTSWPVWSRAPWDDVRGAPTPRVGRSRRSASRSTGSSRSSPPPCLGRSGSSAPVAAWSCSRTTPWRTGSSSGRSATTTASASSPRSRCSPSAGGDGSQPTGPQRQAARRRAHRGGGMSLPAREAERWTTPSPAARPTSCGHPRTPARDAPADPQPSPSPSAGASRAPLRVLGLHRGGRVRAWWWASCL